MEYPEIKIFVKGEADRKFLIDYMEHINIKCDKRKDKIELCNGNNITEATAKELEKNIDKGGKNIIIFDFDKNNKDEIDKRIKKEIKQSLGNDKCSDDYLKFELFLFPNDKDEGTLEDLLEKIIPCDKRPIINCCWRNYEECLRSKKIRLGGQVTSLTIPNKKAMIFAYLEALGLESEEIKEKERNYDNKEYWNLDSNELKPLKEFLEKNLKTAENKL